MNQQALQNYLILTHVKKNLANIMETAMWSLIVSVVSTIIFRWAPIPFTPFMLKRCITQKMDGKEMKLDKDWVPLEDISPHLQLAVVCCEDRKLFIALWF